MIIISIDYGDVRTGLAVCDKNEILASPVCVISERNPLKLIEKIKAVAAVKNPELIVVGNPRNMDGSYGSRSQKCCEFAELLEAKLAIKCVMADERLSTAAAYKSLDMSGVYGKKRKEVIDSEAAVVILQSYIDSRS